MLRTIRLTASVLVLTSGIWLASAFLLTQVGQPREASSQASAVNSVAGSATIGPVIRQSEECGLGALDGLPVVGKGVVADELAELAPLLTAVKQPMQPFQSLPPPPATIQQAPPALPGVYRSALDLPPPPLLDAHAPPPLAGSSTWRRPSSRETSRVTWRESGDELASQPGRARPAQERGKMTSGPPLPSGYVVRDGDDLTTIAVGIYGHPAAAALLWEANRDRLSTPDLLPLGMQLRVPPLSTAHGRPDRPGGWIEPSRPPSPP